MTSSGISKPYLDAWLKRTRRELAGSGRLSEAAMILGKNEAGNTEEWRARLLRILEGEEVPGFDLVTEIDSVLARPARVTRSGGIDGDLFG